MSHLNIEVLYLMYFPDGSQRAFKQRHSSTRNKLIFPGLLLKFLRAAVFTLPQKRVQQGEGNEKGLLCSSL